MTRPLHRLAERLPLDLGVGDRLRATDPGTDAGPAYRIVDAERERLREFLPWVDATTSLEVERDFLESMAVSAAEGSSLGMTLESGGELAGLLGLRADPTDDGVEVGYWLAERCVGRGLMTRSVGRLAQLCLDDLGIHRFVLRAATGNHRSCAVAERLGMVHEGDLRGAERLPQGFVDLAVYSLLATDARPPVTPPR